MRNPGKTDKVKRTLEVASVFLMALVYGYGHWYLTVVFVKRPPDQDTNIWLGICMVSALLVFLASYAAAKGLGNLRFFRRISPLIPATIIFINVFFALMTYLGDLYFERDFFSKYILAKPQNAVIDFAIWNGVALIFSSFVLFINFAIRALITRMYRANNLP